MGLAVTANPLRRRLLHVPSADWDPPQIRRALRRPSATPDAVRRLEGVAEKSLGVPVVAFGSARSAMAALFRIAMPAGTKVVLPAYTCVAVPNAVRAAGMRTIWVDVAGPNLDPDAALHSVGRGYALIAQHTYGVPVAAGMIGAARDRGVFVVEDRAHRFDGIGLEGDAAVYSLEHSKVVSGGQGGLAWARDERLAEELRRVRDTLPRVDDQLAARVLRTSAAQAGLARFGGSGSAANSLARRIALRMPIVSVAAQTGDELAGTSMPIVGPHPALAENAIRSIDRAGANRDHRRRVADIYRTRLVGLVPDWLPPGATLVRMPVLVDDADAVSDRLRHLGWDLGPRWFEAPIHPRGSVSGYVGGSAPAAERLAAGVLSLPTHLLVDEATAKRLAVAILAAAADP